MQIFRSLGPGADCFTRDLPFFPLLFQCRVQRMPQRFERELILVPDHVDLDVVGDLARRDIGLSFVNEPFTKASEGGSYFESAAC